MVFSGIQLLLVFAVIIKCCLPIPTTTTIPRMITISAGKTRNKTTKTGSMNQSVWPPLKHHDIWNLDNTENSDLINDQTNLNNDYDDDLEFINNYSIESNNYIEINNFSINRIKSNRNAEEEANSMQNISNKKENYFRMMNNKNQNLYSDLKRKSKVLHIFPVPVDGECLSDDGRRIGTCYNVYECRSKGGQAKGDCAMGFGVCCIFVANCNETVSNNITYLVSPNFPSFMPSNLSSCSLKIKLMNDDISQLRIDFNHFSLGQPNRRTGICDGDVFNVSGGPGGTFSLCGQNSGQHIYYDVGGRFVSRQTLYGSLRPMTLEQLYPNRQTNSTFDLVEVNMNFAQRFLPIRLWEIRITQIPFSQRAPAGCLQFHVGNEGIIQTFNFADNGRHLANQNYRICMRQEREMCSIVYQPCDEQSFRIGPNLRRGNPNVGTSGVSMSGIGSMNGMIGSVGAAGGMGAMFPMPPMMQNAMPMMSSMAPLANFPNTVAANPAMTMNSLPPTVAQPSTAASMAPSVATMASSAANMAATAASMTSTAASMPSTAASMASMAASSTSAAPSTAASTTTMAASSSVTPNRVSASTTGSTMPTMPTTQSMPPTTSSSPVPTTRASTTSTTTTTTIASTTPTPTTPAPSSLSDEVEGSGDFGGDPSVTPSSRPSNVSRRPRPVRGGFDLLGFLRSAFDFGLRHRRDLTPENFKEDEQDRKVQKERKAAIETINFYESSRQPRQIFTSCTDRITLPCIIEDFIGTGLGPLPSCEPIHCGMQFCASGVWPCRVESTVTPFFLNVHFGDGIGKGSAEDNIGACLRYNQIQCI